ncbi:Uncharacterized conserved protein YbjT, contains NAD(P)-binding and DUF2867 domains [Filimonas lacunae]|uniref:Uncharacterized conserved protein YbjT, contains NAD(P)-binding and DUF2867 domains n=1 Tax=Filimonas lacunae TaxID=477680 RepID=A0A173MHD1_9BACT|nr:NAD(P)H-binding protein [Filimonas lacunae]BAV06828.1 hypothetical protein FLA_2848 [Filimonas lacunae]SIS99172.1 Uncharacterized conserved protein YbjT, contains NAD(P)-binding and DUF2867 domains [Filimonas lacunae]
MKIIVTGSLGNISKPLASELIRQGHDVAIISSQAAKQQDIEALGAKAAIGSVEDAAFLTAAFAGADAVYAMTPPNYAASDLIGYYRHVALAYAKAAKAANVPHLVYLSSYGADLEKGSGIIGGSHQAEGILTALDNITITLLRPGYFYYNLYQFTGMIKAQDFMGSNYGGEDKLVMVSPLDIAAAAAEELTNATPQNKVRYIASDEKTCNEVARIIGEAIGKPDLTWLTFTDEQVKNNLLEHGMPPAAAGLLVELNAAIHSGLLASDYEKHPPALGKVKLQDFVKEFAAAYQQG